MARKLTARMKRNGESAVLRMSEKAQAFYKETTPLDLYEVDDYGVTMYVIDGFDGKSELKTFDEVQWLFEQWYDTVHQYDDCEDIIYGEGNLEE